MMIRTALGALALSLSLGLAAPVSAGVTAASFGGFVSSNTAVVPQPRAAVWDALMQPERWWSHSWSGDPANLSLDPRAGGCFCEVIPVPDSWQRGEAEHARVVMVMPDRMLRMSGALGPLQAEGLAGTLTVTLEDEGSGTRILWEYAVGGAARFDPAVIAPTVDAVQGEFLGGLVAWLGRGD